MARYWTIAACALTLVGGGTGRAQAPHPDDAEPVRLTTGFEEGDLGAWESVGTVLATEDRAHSGTSSLRVDTEGETQLSVSPRGGHGTVSMWVYDSGFSREGDAATEYAYGPMWGVVGGDGQVLAFGAIYAPFLDGNGSYGWVSTGQNEWFDRWSSGLTRSEGWHLWEFTITPENDIVVTMDGQKATGPEGPDSAFDHGMVGVFVRGARGIDTPIYVDDVTIEIVPTMPVRPLKQLPRVSWPPPDRHPAKPKAEWTRGPWQDPAFFPTAVWLQAPGNAERFGAAGINCYVGLWQGPTEEQLDQLRAVGMPVLCDQNEAALAHLDDDIIIGWLQQDEPDNAQALNDPATGETQGYGPPVPPAEVVARYEAMKAADPSRPVLLNLGQGLANEAWVGRGSEGKPEDYDTYVWGGDILSFDVYPVTNSRLPDRGHELWYVAKGLDRLRSLSDHTRLIWSVLECTRIGNARALPTSHEIRAQAWMSVIHGATGLVWFVHEFAPTFVEAGLFEHPEQLEAVTQVNGELQSLAKVLNSPTRSELVGVQSTDPEVPVDVLCKEYDGAVYVFAVAMQERSTEARFTLEGLTGAASVEVLGEDRALEIRDGAFTDSFEGWGVHLYRIAR